MFEHVVLLSAVIAGISLFRVLRGQRTPGATGPLGAGGRGHLLLLTVVAGLGLWALRPVEDDGVFWGIISIAATSITILVPAGLDRASRWAFARGHFSWAVRLAAWRVALMPGAGLTRGLEIVRALDVLERDGLDAALAYLQRMAADAESTEDAALVHEQIVTLLLHGQRWREGIEYYERHFHPGYAVFRPALALSLLRAYGERGNLERAAQLLRAFESSHARGEPRALEMVAQAWLTFVAYAGESRVVDELSKEGSLAGLGVSPAAAAFLRGVAWSHAGDQDRAQAALREVEALAGPTDHSVLAQARGTLASLGRGGVVDDDDDTDDAAEEGLSAELERYKTVVGQRLRAAARLRAKVRRRAWGRGWVSLVAAAVVATVYGIGIAAEFSGTEWFALGATSSATWVSGAWWRALTSPWLHIDLVSLCITLGALGIGGRALEVRRGSARAAVVLVAAPALGMVVGQVLGSFPIRFGAGGSLLAVAAVVGGAAPLIIDPPRGVDRKQRRNALLISLALLLGSGLNAIPTPIGLDVDPVAWLTTGCLAFALAAMPMVNGKATTWLERGVAVALLAVPLTGAWLTFHDDPEALAASGTQDCVERGVHFELGPQWQAMPEGVDPLAKLFQVPLFADALLDGVSLRTGSLVQLVVAVDAVDDEQSAVLVANPQLRHEITVRPHDWTEGRARWPRARGWTLRRNGEVVAWSFERPVGDARVALVVAPPSGGAARDGPALAVELLAAATPDPATGEAVEPTACELVGSTP